MVAVARHAVLIVDSPPDREVRRHVAPPGRRSGFSRPTRLIVLPRNVICDGGAGWIERRFGGAATPALTWLYVKQPTIRVTAASKAVRTTLSRGWISTSCSGSLNFDERSSSSLTQIRIPTSTV